MFQKIMFFYTLIHMLMTKKWLKWSSGLNKIQRTPQRVCTNMQELFASETTKRVLDIFLKMKDFTQEEKKDFYEAIQDRLQEKHISEQKKQLIEKVYDLCNQDLINCIGKMQFKTTVLNSIKDTSILIEQYEEENNDDDDDDEYYQQRNIQYNISIEPIKNFLLQNKEVVEDQQEEIVLSENTKEIISVITDLLQISEEDLNNQILPEVLSKEQIQKLSTVLGKYATKVKYYEKYNYPKYEDKQKPIANIDWLTYLVKQWETTPEDVDKFAEHYYLNADSLERKMIIAWSKCISVDVASNLMYNAFSSSKEEDVNAHNCLILEDLMNNPAVSAMVKANILYKEIIRDWLEKQYGWIKAKYGSLFSDKTIYELAAKKDKEDATLCAEYMVHNMLNGHYKYCENNDMNRYYRYTLALDMAAKHLPDFYIKKILDDMIWSAFHDCSENLTIPYSLCTQEEIEQYESTLNEKQKAENNTENNGEWVRYMRLDYLKVKEKFGIDEQWMQRRFKQFSDHGHDQHHKAEFVFQLWKMLWYEPTDDLKHRYVKLLVDNVVRYKRKRESLNYGEKRVVLDYLEKNAHLFLDDEKIETLWYVGEWNLSKGEAWIDTLKIANKERHMLALAEKEICEKINNEKYPANAQEIIQKYAISKEKIIELICYNEYRNEHNYWSSFSTPWAEDTYYPVIQMGLTGDALQKCLQAFNISMDDMRDIIIANVWYQSKDWLKEKNGCKWIKEILDIYELWNEPKLQDIIKQYQTLQELQQKSD